MPQMVECEHGKVMMRDACPACLAASDTKHEVRPVRVMGFKGRSVIRCTACSLPKGHQVHAPVRQRKRRRAVNTNRQGANFELQIMEELRSFGYDVARSSGSRGKVDVFAIGDGYLVMIQAKISNAVIPPAERRAVIGMALRCGALPVSAWRDNGTIRYRELTGPGPFEWVHWTPQHQKEQNSGQ